MFFPVLEVDNIHIPALCRALQTGQHCSLPTVDISGQHCKIMDYFIHNIRIE